MSIRTKLLAALSVILVTAFVVTSLINYAVTREAVREELLNSSLPLTGKNIYSEIHSAMMRPILVSSSMANDTFLMDWVEEGEQDKSAIIKYLNEISEEYGFLTAFLVSAATDKYYYQKGILKEVNPRDPHDVWFYSFLRSMKKYKLDVDTNEAEDNKLTIFVNFRLENDSGRLLGVTGVGVNMDHAAKLLEQARQEYGRNVYLVDQDGLVQVHSNKNLIEKHYITDAEGIGTVAKEILVPREDAINFEFDRDDRHILISTRYIPEFEWYLIVEQDEGHALAGARANLFRTLGIGLGASVLIIILCVVTINHYQARLERMAKTDPLTGAGNRRALEEQFELAAYKADRYGDDFSILIMDLDKFKEINDIYGHMEGDTILKAVAEGVKRTIRPTDTLSRWGGDEFIVLMDGTADDAEALAERIRTELAGASHKHVISFSSGIAQYEEGDDIGSLTHRADQAMYRAKANGGDCVVCQTSAATDQPQ